jgi:hypothetical protein
MFKKKLIASVFLATLSMSSFAGLLIDPYIGYKFGSTEQTLKSLGVNNNGSYENSTSGYALGSRLGFSFLGLMGGLDFNVGSMSDKADTFPSGNPQSGKDDYSTKQFGLFVGYNLPVMLRFWGTYYFSSSQEVTKTNATTGSDKGDKYSGSGYGLGVGFTGLPFVSVNLEYKKTTFDKFVDGPSGIRTDYPSTFSSELEASEIFLSVSLPIDI